MDSAKRKTKTKNKQKQTLKKTIKTGDCCTTIIF